MHLFSNRSQTMSKRGNEQNRGTQGIAKFVTDVCTTFGHLVMFVLIFIFYFLPNVDTQTVLKMFSSWQRKRHLPEQCSLDLWVFWLLSFLTSGNSFSLTSEYLLSFTFMQHCFVVLQTGLSGNAIMLSVLYSGGMMMTSAQISVGDLTSFLLYAGFVGISFGGKWIILKLKT